MKRKPFSRIFETARFSWRMSVLFNSGERAWLWWYFGVNVSTWRSQ